MMVVVLGWVFHTCVDYIETVEAISEYVCWFIKIFVGNYFDGYVVVFGYLYF